MLPAEAVDGLPNPEPDDVEETFARAYALADHTTALAAAWRMAQGGHFTTLFDAVPLPDLGPQECESVLGWLRSAESLGEPAAATVLAYAGERGLIGVPPDLDEALRRLGQAAPTSDVARLLLSCHWLLPPHGESRDPAEQRRARLALEEVLDQRRMPRLEAVLGHALLHGIGGRLDREEGMRLLRASATDPFGAYVLGFTLLEGPEELRDPAGALPHLTRAVAASATAAVAAGRLLLEGPEELRDPAEGIRLLEIAEAGGEPGASELRSRWERQLAHHG